jgi:alkylation response protein AidB-like acyl-CoA dehydrogenase
MTAPPVQQAYSGTTAVMEYAASWLLARCKKHAGLAAMLTMMNNACLGVATQGIGVAEAATHRATCAMTANKAKLNSALLPEHADAPHAGVDRLITARAILLANAVAIDMSNATGDADGKRGQVMTRSSKAFGTDIGAEIVDGHPDPTAAWASSMKTGVSALRPRRPRHHNLRGQRHPPWTRGAQ